MPIPDFDTILNALPPHTGDPRFPEDLSPYHCSEAEIRERLVISDRRRKIFNGYLELRQKLLAIRITGFQWLGGSFLENIEAQQSRDPNDLDVVTFVATPAEALSAIATENPWLVDNREIKSRYAVDHFLVPLTADPLLLVDLTRYWYGLFSHRRDGIWKGMLTIDLNSLMDQKGTHGELGDEHD